MVRFCVVFCFTFVALALGQSLVIDNHEIPCVPGSYAQFRQNSASFNWPAFDSLRQVWDLTVYPGDNTARVGLRPYTEGRPPAPDSMAADFPPPQVVEFDTLGSGAVQWGYTYVDSTGFKGDGVDFTQTFRFLGNYRPDNILVQTPCQRGSQWSSQYSWSCVLISVPYTMNESRTKRVVARGKVKVPMSGEYFWPCLVVRDSVYNRDNLGTTARRWMYHWLVPGHFCGANFAAMFMSTDGAGQNFTTVDQAFQMQSCDIPGWDLIPPTFSNTTVLRDTNFTGPFVVTSTITDDKGMGSAWLCYRLNPGMWQSLPADSARGSVYYFHIPQVTSPVRINYYVMAKDSFSVNRNIDFWTTWPVCSPESTMITFDVGRVGIVEERNWPEQGTFVVPGVATSGFASMRYGPARPGPAVVRVYDAAGRAVLVFSLENADAPGIRTVPLDISSLPSGVYLVRLDANGFAATRKLLIQR